MGNHNEKNCWSKKCTYNIWSHWRLHTVFYKIIWRHHSTKQHGDTSVKRFGHNYHRENPKSFMLKARFVMLWKVDVTAFYLDGSTKQDLYAMRYCRLSPRCEWDPIHLDVMQRILSVTDHPNYQSTLRNTPEERRS
jgi:hypothetical protein